MRIYFDKIFENPVDIIETDCDFEAAFSKIECYKREKKYLLGYITYDFKYLYFEVFDSYKKYHPSKPKPLGTIVRPLVSKKDYFEAIEKIKEKILKGDTYEVNYTYPFEVFSNLDGLDLYEAILNRQNTPYCAYMENEKVNLLSFSPELFFRLKGNKIFTKPMKGTISRGKDAKEDEYLKNFLYNDTKNRAENIMIVDLLRNDISKISKTGTVRVNKLFDIEEHPTLFQMTSEIEAQIRDDVSLFDIFKALFPCGSITGAPKLSTMKIIDEIEPYNRNIYCGAIGFISEDECEFSVAIRILYGKNHKYFYHAGGAIVWDSNAEDEWQETITKSKIILEPFCLIETAIDDWQNHTKRMKKSAHELGFRWNEKIEDLKIPKDKILRVLLHKNGEFEVEYKEINEIKSNKIKSTRKINSSNPFLYHKTTIRQKAPEDVFDDISINEKGELCEGTFTNIALEIDSKLYTPPASCGLLAGTYRQKLIDEGKIIEKILYLDDLKRAKRVFCFNSVRKMLEAEYVDN